MPKRDAVTTEQVEREADYWRDAAKGDSYHHVSPKKAEELRDICDELHKRMVEE